MTGSRRSRRGLRPAVFLDRDGTLTPEVGHVGDPRRIRLLPGVPGALRALRRAGFLLVCVTNQSGVARGLYDRRALRRVLRRFARLLEESGAPLDAIYACPHHPDFGPPCGCRKPGVLMLRRAAEDLGIDLRGSVSIGDKMSDVLVGRRVGGRGILLAEPGRLSGGGAGVKPDDVASNLPEATRRLLRQVRTRAWRPPRRSA
jgi:histidinol-phosphate phosphatase family protein